jgi:peptide/nickel transport system permease protein
MTAALLDTPGPTARRRLRLPRSRKLVVGVSILTIFAICAVVGPIIFPNANQSSPDAFASPSAAHLLGTTNLGQDVFEQVLNGARGSLGVGLVAGVLSTAIAMVIGIVAGYLGGLTDDLLSLFANIVLVIPSLPLIILITDYVHSRGYLTIAVVIALTAWASTSRVLRTQTLSVRNRDFVDAARVAGEPTWRIITFEVLPNLLPIIANSLVFSGLFAILTEAGLDFIGLGTTNASSWGSILYYAQNAQALSLGRGGGSCRRDCASPWSACPSH